MKTFSLFEKPLDRRKRVQGWKNVCFAFLKKTPLPLVYYLFKIPTLSDILSHITVINYSLSIFMEENHLLLYILSTRQIYLQSYSILFNFILFKLYILNW